MKCDDVSKCSRAAWMWQPGPTRGFSAVKKKIKVGYAVAHLVEALHHKPVGRVLDSHWGHWDFTWT